MNIICNEHVYFNLESTGTYPNGTRWERYCFTPDSGYALWRDNEDGNLDPETGEPWCYWLSINCDDAHVEEYAHHIWAKLIDDTMEVFGDTNKPVAKMRMMTMSLSSSQAEEPHTYIDANGVEREKRGVY